MTIKNNRIIYLDFLKGFLLSCVCLSHFGYLPLLFKYLIIPTGSIYVPVFFLISGVLFNESISFLPFIKKKFKSLFIPYFFFFVVFVVFDWNIYLKTPETLNLYFNALLHSEGPPKASPIWFMIRLFECNLLYYLITLFSPKNCTRIILILICSLFGYMFYLYSFKLLFGLDAILSSILFFGVGHLGSNFFNDFLIYLNSKSWVLNFLVLIFLFSISIFLDHINSHGVLAQNEIHNYFLFYVSSFSGGIALMILSKFLCEKYKTNLLFEKAFTFLKYLSENALVILGTHVFIIILIDQIQIRVYFLSPFIGFILKCVSIIFLTYYLITPFLYDKFYFIFGIDKPSYRTIK